MTACYGQHILTVPAADNVIRILPPLNITEDEIAGVGFGFDLYLSTVGDAQPHG